MIEFSNLAKEAYNLLNKQNNRPELPFIKNKNAIKELFKFPVMSYEPLVLVRLGVIDDFYSTNINKSNDAIYELATDIVSLGNDSEVKEKFINFYNKNDDSIGELFGKKRGWLWDKNAQEIVEGRQSISLISKYAYFLTEFNFPIYDSLMRRMLLKLGINTQNITIEQYVKNIKRVCDAYEITIDELDACGWLIGKIEDATRNQSSKASLIGEIKNYSDFIDKAQKYSFLSKPNK